jgi:hypothetical protein
VKDSQAKRLYAWEREFYDWKHDHLTLKEMRNVVHAACDRYGVPYPAKVARQKKGKSYSQSNKKGIRFLKGQHYNLSTALHETAHHVVKSMYGKTVEHHGKEYIGIYLDLLLTFKVAPKDALIPSLRARGLKFITRLPNREKARKR